MADLGIRTLGNPFEAPVRLDWLGKDAEKRMDTSFRFFFPQKSEIIIHEGLLHVYYLCIYDTSLILLMTKLLEDELELTPWFPFGSRNAHRMSPSNYKEKDTVARLGLRMWNMWMNLRGLPP